MLGIDGAGNIYRYINILINAYINITCRWAFDRNNPVAHAVWGAFHDHISQTIKDSVIWTPKVVQGH